MQHNAREGWLPAGQRSAAGRHPARQRRAGRRQPRRSSCRLFQRPIDSASFYLV